MTNRYLPVILGTLAVAGCAGVPGSTYQFGPTEAPLHYTFEEHGALLIETPMGQQRQTDSTVATLVLEIGASEAAGRHVTASFEALDFWLGNDGQRQHTGGGELLGKPFTGTLAGDGTITVTAAPEIPASLEALGDPGQLFNGLLPPLPPGGDESAGSWEHRVTETTEGVVTVETTYDGMASFAGDTTWNGVAARVILSEGTTTTSGHGTPEGAPGEIEFTMSGKKIIRYIWDPRGGTMLASSSSTETEGEIEVISMGMTMPISYQGGSDVRFVR
jgi:hypothetical protein